jgi:hypothetical protein
MAMKVIARQQLLPPFVLNSLTRSWRIVNASRLLTHSIAEYVKLAKIAIVHVLRSVEDESCFF